jgi:hypothetical protein
VYIKLLSDVYWMSPLINLLSGKNVTLLIDGILVEIFNWTISLGTPGTSENLDVISLKLLIEANPSPLLNPSSIILEKFAVKGENCMNHSCIFPEPSNQSVSWVWAISKLYPSILPPIKKFVKFVVALVDWL